MEPKYQAVADVLRKAIARGVFSDGQALSTEAELKDRFGVSRQTVRQAIALLENDGLVQRKRGSGTYVAHGPRRHGSVLNVGVIITYITDYIFPSIVRGVESVLSDQNCLMSLSATYNDPSREEALLTRLLATPLDGLIVEGTRTALPNPNLPVYEKLRERNIPYVFINGYYPALTQCVHVVTDDEAGGYLAVKSLMKKGFTRIAGIFKSDDMQGRLRHTGFVKALLHYRLYESPEACDKAVCWFTTQTKDRFLRQGPGAAFLNSLTLQADSLVCYNDEIALLVLSRLPALGLSVPEDLSIISFDDSPYASVCSPKLTSLAHPKEEFGRTAARTLLGLMRGKKEESVVMPWTLIERGSVTDSQNHSCSPA
ncbi:MAG: GntR family transcriptional regulator [Clostridia bacterium]|nr:GntR family transcriptional regulator [Clostridia bacterium]